MKSKFFYGQLAKSNIKRNQRNFVPYWISCVAVIAFFFNLLNMTDILTKAEHVYGNSTVAGFLTFGSVIVGFLAMIFIFYANGFLMKNRKKEIGLYGILGLEKRNVAIMLFLESLVTAGLSIVGGVFSGVVFGKLVFLIMSKIIRYEVGVAYTVSWQAIYFTVIFFALLFLAVLFFNLVSMHLTEPIELLKSKNIGEKKERFTHLKALVGFACLAGGYYIAIATTNPLKAMLLFTVAVILVIVATHSLFMAGSVVMLRRLKKSKRFYYRPTNFISTSSLIYRMKKNAVGLANICILSCMVIVTVGGTATVYNTMEKMMQKEFPAQYTVRWSVSEQGFEGRLDKFVAETAKKHNLTVKNQKQYSIMESMLLEDGEGYILPKNTEFNVYAEEGLDKLVWLTVLTQKGFGELTGAKAEQPLQKGEVLLSALPNRAMPSTFFINGTSYPIRGIIEEAYKLSIINPRVTGGLHQVIMVVADTEEMQRVLKELDERSNINIKRYFDVEGSPADVKAFDEDLIQERRSGSYKDNIYIAIRELEVADMYAVNGGLYFLGIFLGSLFLLLTVLIIYFKQMSEGEEDRERFIILKKVGLSAKEARSVIRKQMVMIFFLPLVTAIIHVSVACVIIARVLTIGFGIVMKDLLPYMISTMGAFAVIYFVVFLWTSRVYYQIVGGGERAN